MSDEQTPRQRIALGARPRRRDRRAADDPARAPGRHGHRGAGTAPAAPKRTWTQRVRGNGGLVGAALALVLVSGVGGFAVGHATAGHDRFGLVGERFPGGPGGGFPGADGQLPPPRHDDDDDGFGTPPGSDDDGGGTENESGSTL